ncbi:SAM-dependent methyltransferase [Noviherbaspirillum sp.]|uniref:SAM-dependent methyltransferase n=1 Tax=Noviherbaspirillum sp. TaxID=1926288 RepID=UPI002FE12648
MLTSCMCTEAALTSGNMAEWAIKIKERPNHLHRKIWEWCFACEALAERGMLRPGMKGLGFAVGTEPLTAVFAGMGARITATDLDFERAQEAGWTETNEHASGYAQLNERGLCDPAEIERLVQFRFADMNDIGSEFDNQYDFVWSSCALEHLGSLQHGMQFIYNAMRCLKPGGYAVHTTEYNISSNEETIDSGPTVLYRKRDMEEVIQTLRAQGHHVDVDWNEGQGYADQTIDLPPYKQEVHLRLQIQQYVVTSFGIIVQKGTGNVEQPKGRLMRRLSSLFGR